MPLWLDNAVGFLSRIVVIGVMILALYLALGVVFGSTNEFLIFDVTSNLMAEINLLSGHGLAGFIVLGFIGWLFAKMFELSQR